MVGRTKERVGVVAWIPDNPKSGGDAAKERMRKHWQGKESKCEGEKKLREKVEQKKGGKGESSRWGGIEDREE